MEGQRSRDGKGLEVTGWERIDVWRSKVAGWEDVRGHYVGKG